MGKKLYVGNLAYSIGDGELQRLFAAHGSVASAQVIMDRDTGRSKGFGFVEMGSDQEAQAAISAMNGAEVEGRALAVNEARPKPEGGGRGPAAAAAAADAAATAAAGGRRRRWRRWLRRGRRRAALLSPLRKETQGRADRKIGPALSTSAAYSDRSDAINSSTLHRLGSST